ncbi:MAG TPA: hypothetical protein VKE69_05010, partial [Planctomycetota bacterium]|nr:hypothetical protein [Planctomycetota bacterium]
MKVLACPDAPALEGAFVERLAAALEARADPLAPITVVAPTARLLARLRVVAVRRLGAFAGVRFAHYRALAERVLLLAGEPPGALVPPAALEEIALASAREGAGPLAERAREVSALAPLLASTFRDLRDAGVTGEEAAALRREGIDGAVLAAYARFDRALEGRADAAALCRRASRAAKRGAGGLGLVLHVGVFDVVGSVAELIDAVASATPFEAIVLGVADGPAFEHGRARSPKPDAHATPRSPLAARIALLFDDRATPSPPSDAVEWIDAPGPDEELEAAARLALRWHEEGVPLEEIAILARTLEPYAPRVEATLAEHGLPFTSSATLPALRRPGARALLDLLDAVSPRPTRPGLIRLLRSPALAWAELAIAPIDFHPDRFDRLSRELAPRSVADWTEALPASAEEARAVARLEEEEEAERDVADARALAAIVRELAAALASVHAAGLVHRDVK